MNIYLEILGYIGTALVIVSMMMTSVVRLRLFNIAGSIISIIYAALSGTWPIVVLNATLAVINSVQLVRERFTGHRFSLLKLAAGDATLAHFLSCYESDIGKYYPTPDTLRSLHEECERGEQDGGGVEIYAVFCGAAAVGVIAGERCDGVMRLIIDYTVPQFRDTSVGRFIGKSLCDLGIHELHAATSDKKQIKYLTRVGFKEENGILVRRLGTTQSKGEKR